VLLDQHDKTNGTDLLKYCDYSIDNANDSTKEGFCKFQDEEYYRIALDSIGFGATFEDEATEADRQVYRDAGYDYV
jgi:hypothetical protein